MKYSIDSIQNYGVRPALDILNMGFSDYIIPIQLDEPGFFQMIRIDGIDLSISQIISRNDKVIGTALISRRGWNSRLAGMAIVPEARGQGAGTWLIERLISQAKTRGDHRMELEVIKGNEPAIALYKNLGFKKSRLLLSFQAQNPKGNASELEVVDIWRVSQEVASHGFAKLPWQLSSHNLAQYGPPNLAFHHRNAWMVISSPKMDKIQLRSIIVHPDYRHQGRAAQLMEGLFAEYPDKTWNIPAIFPEEMENVFKRVGFIKRSLSQLQFEIDFV